MCVARLWRHIMFNSATSKLVAIRSDGLIVPISFPSDEKCNKEELLLAFKELESFRNCKCTMAESCNVHNQVEEVKGKTI